MRKVLACIAILVLGACAQDAGNENEEDPGTDFSLTGTVVEVREGEEAEGVPDTDADTDVDAQTGGETDEDAIEPGAIVVDSDEDLDDCTAEGDGYTVYFEGDTAFEPVEAPDDENFPGNLEGAEVQVTGTYYSGDGGGDGEDCVLVAETIDVAGEGSADEDRPSGDTATFSPGPRPTDMGADAEATPAGDTPDEGTAPPGADTSP